MRLQLSVLAALLGACLITGSASAVPLTGAMAKGLVAQTDGNSPVIQVQHRRHGGHGYHGGGGGDGGAVAAGVIGGLFLGAIIAGHVLAVLVAHGLAWRLHRTASGAALSQLPLTALMVGYTVFGLWLLSTPTAG